MLLAVDRRRRLVGVHIEVLLIRRLDVFQHFVGLGHMHMAVDVDGEVFLAVGDGLAAIGRSCGEYSETSV